MRERNQLNKEILKILLKKQEAEKKLKEKQKKPTGITKNGVSIQVENPEAAVDKSDGWNEDEERR